MLACGAGLKVAFSRGSVKILTMVQAQYVDSRL